MLVRMIRRMAFALALGLGVARAEAPDRPWVQATGLFATGYWPGALYGEGRLQLNTPLHRSDSVLFRSTYAGAGVMAGAAPLLLTFGPRFAIQPIDAFELTVQGQWTALGGDNGSGLLPYERIGRKLDGQRNARADDAPTGQVWSVVVTPSLMARAGPVVAFATPQVVAERVVDGGDSRYVYDAPRDLVVERRDVLLQANYGLLGEIARPGVLVRAGAALRHAQAFGSGDRSVALGGLATVKPEGDAWPTFVALVMPYLADADRVGGAPMVIVAAKWDARVWTQP
jgi:hypothetical protein